jgi:hypothetical protein
MFIGHIAVGFASKRVAPRASLGWLMAAPIFLDLLWPIFLLLGIEHVEPASGAPSPFLGLAFTDYPWTHGLTTSIGWGVLFGLVVRWRTGDGRAASVATASVISHWVLDFVTHIPDLPLWPGGPKVGLGLWRSVPATVVIEVVMYAAGVLLYVRGTRARDRAGRFSLAGFVAVLGALYLTNFGPPPSDMRVLAWSALTLWLIPFWAAWFDRHRTLVMPTAA